MISSTSDMDHFIMVGGAQSMRSLPHFVELFKLADGCGLLQDPDMAAARMRSLLSRSKKSRVKPSP